MLIIADDYTGAADAAVGLAVHGMDASILLDGSGQDAGTEVVAWDLDTRHRAGDDAYKTLKDALSKAPASGFVFKKIDSTLRGRIGSELRALSETFGGRDLPILIAPAVPKNDRTVIGGQVYVRGVPLEETDVWRHERATFDRDLPVRMRDRLARSGLSVEEIHLDVIREGRDALNARLIALGSKGVDAVVLDGETPDDLLIIAQTATSFETPPVCVGAAGLSRTLGYVMSAYGPETKPSLPTVDQPVLLAIASQSDTARAQIDCVAARPDVMRVEIGASPIENDVALATDALSTGRHVLLCPAAAATDALSRDHAVEMAGIVARIIGKAGALIASGGDTARACLSELGCNRIRISGELSPGVVLGHPDCHPDLLFVSKAGDFGSVTTLSNCIDLLTSSKPETAA
ncbi:MAG: four-carbon acid sugar kinase family protein [Rhodobacteraceae bacterium]|nr:four-carbon acid sugar kinase family protein [Paracoccaceae bacterium]